ncbi:MAG TPA: VWA domain-containing protein [Nocardioides sp.]|nr:VWA domain-containing protein [Nocardioides sp.]
MSRTVISTEADVRGGDEILLAFARAVRAGGVPVTQDRAHEFLAATALLGADDPTQVRTAGRSTLCTSPEDLERFDQVFEAFFNVRHGLPRSRPVVRPETSPHQLPLDDSDGGELEEADDVIRAAASAAEVLRHRDVASLSAGEKQRLAAMFATLRPRAPLRRTARHQRWHNGQVDASRTLRESLRRMGEPAEIAWRRRATKPRRVVLLVDVSGSMSSYADALLRLAHRLTQGIAQGNAQGPGRVETFTIGTRVTHVSRAMRIRDPERALVAAGDTVPDWSGGTRLGETLRFFLDRWGQRGMARGAVVVVFSDGWERGDTTVLAEQMARLRRIAHRVVWVNPHRGKDGYEAVQTGVLAALPYCHDFVAGHSLATYADLVEVVAHA